MLHSNGYPLHMRLSYIGIQIEGEPICESINRWDFHYFDLEFNLSEAIHFKIDVREWWHTHKQYLIQAKLKKMGIDDNIFLSMPNKVKCQISSREYLAERNHQYRNRVLYGANRRADIITAVESGWGNPSAVANILGCSYEPAHRVLRDYYLFEAVIAKKKP